MNENREYFQAGNRQYSIHQDEFGAWHLSYQPINAKNGQPWQAVRHEVKNSDAHLFATRDGNCILKAGPVPPLSERPENCSYRQRCYSSRELALAQVKH